jgi:two-component system OmpR family response regulator
MARGGRGTVLVVDDEPSLRLLCRVNLELDGFDVSEAGTLADARRILEEQRIDLVLLVVHLAGQDGRDLLEELRSRDADVRVVMLTGSVDVTSGGLSAADRVVAKPFEPMKLVEVVHEVLEKPRVDSPL